jgi:DNA-binding NarL/FixJ family response regulator
MHTIVFQPELTRRSAYLEARSALAKRLAGAHAIRRVTIVDDEAFAADVIAGLVRRTLGRDVRVDSARSMMVLHTIWMSGLPDLVVLDDRLGAIGTATTHVSGLRRLNYRGPIIVVSQHMTPLRCAELVDVGAAAVLHKDALDTVTFMELLLKLLDGGLLPPAAA